MSIQSRKKVMRYLLIGIPILIYIILTGYVVKTNAVSYENVSTLGFIWLLLTCGITTFIIWIIFHLYKWAFIEKEEIGFLHYLLKEISFFGI